MRKRIIIPARYGSTRLPAKLLIKIAGKSILQHTYERALACNFDSVVIATDHPEIAEVCEAIHAPYCMTAAHHLTGTDRSSDAMEKMGYSVKDIILILQADEPLIPIANLLKATENLIQNPHAMVATLCERITEKSDAFNPNYVKVVADNEHYALYFSRAPIPWARDDFPAAMPEEGYYFRHIGIYTYRGAFLKQYPKLSQSPLERLENLEQLRILHHGYKIHVGLAPESNPPGVDTAASLQEVREILES